MPIPRLKLDDTALLVIDVQQRLLPTLADRERLLNNCAVLLAMAEVLELPVIVTEQNPGGLGRTAEPLLEAMPEQTVLIEKTRFSAAVDDVIRTLQMRQRSSVLIAGIEAQVCVLQTALDLLAGGWPVFLCSDAISAGQRDQIAPALERVRQAGGIVTGVLSAMYELMADSTHPAFRRCLELAKSVDQGVQ